MEREEKEVFVREMCMCGMCEPCWHNPLVECSFVGEKGELVVKVLCPSGGGCAASEFATEA